MNWQTLCKSSDLIDNAGVCAKFNEEQVALFSLFEGEQQTLFALGNWDPIGKANVLSRGVIGSIGEELVVASPLYKQHFSLLTGKCQEDENVSVPVYQVRIQNDLVEIAA